MIDIAPQVQSIDINPVARPRRPSPPERREKKDCIICLEECGESDQGNICIAGGDCRYSAHAACISVWFDHRLTCPVCRTSVPMVAIERDIGIDVTDIDTDNDDDNRLAIQLTNACFFPACITIVLVVAFVLIYSIII